MTTARAKPENRKLPAYLEVAEALEGAILRGDYGPGERLPTELALGEAHGVNRHTAAKALNHLQHRGLVYRVERSGSFVHPGRLEYPSIGAEVSISEAVRALGLEPSHKIFGIREVGAYGRIPAEMEVSSGEPLVVFDRISRGGEIPLLYSTKHYRERLFPDLAEALREVCSTHSLREFVADRYGVKLHKARTVLEFEAADPEVSRRLFVPMGAAVVKTEALHVLEDGTPAQWNVTYSRGDAMRWYAKAREVKGARR